ncbi:flagellar basal-body MS-ring/collar protein FliF [Curvivirga sp.]|uniref:flagellar basal-body MS-ring/collar protein FliF n=1 Tax=Curvivirga sp. TaxID=2856848 RepID=UPI003B5931AF
MDAFIQFLRKMGPARIGMIAGISLLVLGFIIFLATRFGEPNMSLLYSNLDSQSTQEITTQLASQGIPFEIRQNGSQVFVPSERVGDVRIAMAEQGLSGSIIGYEIFDREETLGTSSFLQEVNRVRALEGELSRTITSMSSVKAARVHLVLPKRELFSRDLQEPSASIIIKMKGPQRLEKSQISAIQHLVATAVPRLKPSSISIVDDQGTLLHKGGDEEGAAGEDSLDLQTQYENRIQRNLQDLLERTMGIGKVRVEVNADMDFTQSVINKEEYDPEGSVLVSSNTIEETSNSSEADEENVSVGNNLPDGQAAAGGGNSEQTSSIQETSNFANSKTITNQVKNVGEINRLSIAVLIDGHYARGEPTEENEQGDLVYTPRTAEEMQQIETLVKSAVGFDELRGDTVEIVNMRFAELPLSEADGEITYFGLSAADIRSLAQTLILGLLAVLVILLVVRPMLNRLLDTTPSDELEETVLLTDQSGQPIVAGGQPGVPAAGVDLDFDEDDEFDQMIDIAQIEGKVKASSMRKIGEIIENHPEEAVSILRNWMHQPMD